MSGPAVLTRLTGARVEQPATAAQPAAAPTSVVPQVLPAVDWAALGAQPPEVLPLGSRRPEDPLPRADIVVLTWTSAEWFALDHVFLNSDRSGDYGKDYEWKKAWLPYTREVGRHSAGPGVPPLWGSFRMVRITDRSGRGWRVLLFKCNAHLAHPPWIDGLTAMLRNILADTQPDRIYTIGTAGGARLDQHLGDSVITNAAQLDLQRPQNTTDPDDGALFRCASWFPSTALLQPLQDHALLRMDRLADLPTLGALLAQLKAQHPDDPAIAALTLDDLLNEALRPAHLQQPKVMALKDVPLLSTDFYYIASGDSAGAYAFLEMDDAVIAREANRAGVRFACLRNISDPVVPDRTQQGAAIAAGVRADWSGLIYSNFGLFTSFNSALATWATIAGEGSAVYDPPRGVHPDVNGDSLEVQLAFQVRACGSCDFFWPPQKSAQPYGPYTAFDFDVNTPYTAAADANGGTSSKPIAWVKGRTRPPAFPNGEIGDGCRKAPIMTIGINPNLTAFSPGQTGAAWAYPDFASAGGTDAWTKYAWYYRYRSVYQERLQLDFVRRFVLPEGRITAPRPGRVTAATRPTDSPAWRVSVRYDGDAVDTELQLPGTVGDFPYMLFFDSYPPHNVFAAGDVIAGRLAVPEGISVPVMQQQQGYYMQFVPVLQQFQDMLHTLGHEAAHLRIGEDVSQLDMVACASPHWNAGFLGGSAQSIATIVDNCVNQNAWAIKHLVQTRPAVLYVVSESSWNMLRATLGGLVRRDLPLSTHPADKDFTLLRETTDPAHPAWLEFDVTVDGQAYRHRTRLVITPHFSYDSNFLPQVRVPGALWEQLRQQQPDWVRQLTPEHGVTVVLPPAQYPHETVALQLPAEAQAREAALHLLRSNEAAWKLIEDGYVDPHALMASVLEQLYSQGAIRWQDSGEGRGFLARTEGACNFCSNRHWQFPGGCSYGKTAEPQPPAGYLEKVAAQIVATGKPATA